MNIQEIDVGESPDVSGDEQRVRDFTAEVLRTGVCSDCRLNVLHVCPLLLRVMVEEVLKTMTPAAPSSPPT